MTIKNTYIACDGEEFETEEECLQYERGILGHKGILFFDSERNVIENDDPVLKYELSLYIYIVDKDQAKVYFEWLNNYAGYNYGDDFETGHVYMYNTRTCEYEDLAEKINELIGFENDIFGHVKEIGGSDNVNR